MNHWRRKYKPNTEEWTDNYKDYSTIKPITHHPPTVFIEIVFPVLPGDKQVLKIIRATNHSTPKKTNDFYLVVARKTAGTSCQAQKNNGWVWYNGQKEWYTNGYMKQAEFELDPPMLDTKITSNLEVGLAKGKKKEK